MIEGTNDILYLKRSEINDDLWNHRIAQSANGLIYGYAFYLDAMADNWDALIYKNYDAVMPLPWRKKWGIHYLYQPFLMAQLGMFGNHITVDLFDSFLNAIPKKFQYWDVALNHQNLFPASSYPVYARNNFVLHLQPVYSDLYKNYRDNIKRNIKKSGQFHCRVAKDIDIEKIIGLTKLQAAETPQKEFDNFKKLYAYLKEKSEAKTYGILSEKDELLASCVLFFSHKRAYYILVGNHPNGRTLGASHALIDAIIKDHSGLDLWLDFEGSDIRNLAFFYSSFGAIEEPYAAIQLNRLPWWAKWLKG